MNRKQFITIYVVLVMISIPMCVSKAEESEIRPLVAYNARVTPTIDGIMSPQEWNDTVLYTYTRYNSGISDAPIKLQCALKHNNQYLFMLFNLNVREPIGEVSILTFPRDNMSFEAEKALVIYSNGTTTYARLDKTGIVPQWSTIPSTSACTSYLHGEYTVEIQINKSFFNTTNNYSLFNIEYTTWFYGPDTIAIGDVRHVRPGFVFTSRNYVPVDDTGQNLWYWLPTLLTVVIVPAGILLYFLHRKRKMSGKQHEPKDGNFEH